MSASPVIEMIHKVITNFCGVAQESGQVGNDRATITTCSSWKVVILHIFKFLRCSSFSRYHTCSSGISSTLQLNPENRLRVACAKVKMSTAAKHVIHSGNLVEATIHCLCHQNTTCLVWLIYSANMANEQP